MLCSNCGTHNEVGRKFCGECGTRLAAGCPACGAPNAPGVKFCGECGSQLPAGVAGEVATAVAPGDTPAREAERRVVSVMFADLVDFTPLSESKDPEDVREALTRYFEVAREIVSRYGGTVEKFIGDAVMAVWGTPTAHEDDPERAVRAALDLTEKVRAMGAEVGVQDLQVRAAVMTGETAVTVGAEGQGMVAGDVVNTASRLQSVSPPGAVLVAESTYRCARDAIAFEPAGEQMLKGKTAPVQAWRALRVVAKRGGSGRSEGLEPPFVGRDDELRLLKELYHATVRERRARLVSVTGQAGVGKSRLAWEFLKYLDGVVDTVYWHQGRSPAYGQALTFWALGEMVRGRAGIAESDDDATSREKLASTVAEFVPEIEERRSIESALATLLGLGDGAGTAPEELYAAWRTFFQRVAERGPTVLVFEDLHWTDPGVLDFVEHLLAWSRQHPIMIVTLARPELLERRPTWGAGQRNFLALQLEPLADADMTELLTGLVPGLPPRLVRRVLARAEGIPLYAVEIVRMLLDTGRLVADDGRYRLVEDVERLEVPESLASLVTARLDALDPADRSLLQDAAVLGQTFTPGALAAVTGAPPERLEQRLNDLVAREILALDADPRSPERGQYGFVQSVIREVAYATLSRRDRKSRHLAAARYFEWLGEEELAGALASHYLAAYQAAGEGPEADALAAQARVALRAAAERARALHSPQQALAYLEQALLVTPDARERVTLLERAGEAAEAAARFDAAERHLLQAIEWHERQGDRVAAARDTATLGRALINDGRAGEAVEILARAVEGVADIEGAPEIAGLTAELARAFFVHEDYPRAVERAERTLSGAGPVGLVPVVVEALTTKGSALGMLGREHEAIATLHGAIALAESHGLVGSALRARNNLGSFLYIDEPRAALDVTSGARDVARRYGEREWFLQLSMITIGTLFEVGEWDRALGYVRELLEEDVPARVETIVRGIEAVISGWRGDHAHAHELVRSVEPSIRGLTGALEIGGSRYFRGLVAFAEGRFDEANELGMESLVSTQWSMEGSRLAGRAALWLGDEQRLRSSAEALERHQSHGRLFAAARQNLHAAQLLLTRGPDAGTAYVDAARRWRELGDVTELGLCQMEAAVFLPHDRPETRHAADEAREVFASLRAAAMLRLLESRLAERPRTEEPRQRIAPLRTNALEEADRPTA